MNWANSLSGSVGQNIDTCVRVTRNVYPGWKATTKSAAGRAMAARHRHPSAEAAFADPQWIGDSYAALNSWSAFRPDPPGRKRYEEALQSSLPYIRQLTGECVLTFGPGNSATDPLCQAFQTFSSTLSSQPRGIRWVATSKALHFLLPDLVVPMDRNTGQALRFLDNGSGLDGLQIESLPDVYAFFRGIAQSAEGGNAGILRQLEQRITVQGAPRLGLARVVDFAVVGFWNHVWTQNALRTESPSEYASDQLLRNGQEPRTPETIDGWVLTREVAGYHAPVGFSGQRGIVIAIQEWTRGGKTRVWFELAAKPRKRSKRAPRADDRQWVEVDDVTFLAA
jgi:hypothetical protein